MSTATTPIEHITKVIGWSDEERDALKTAKITRITHLKVMKSNDIEKALGDAGMGSGSIGELLIVKRWYEEWLKQDAWEKDCIEKDFDENAWYGALLEHETESDKQATAVEPETTPDSGINVTFEVDTNDIPRLPKNKEIRGQVFHDWALTFKTLMEKAGVSELLDDTYTPPDKASTNEYNVFHSKDVFIRRCILTAIMGTNAHGFVVSDTMLGVEIWKAIHKHYKAADNATKIADDAQEEIFKLTFGSRSSLTPEQFVCRFLVLLKHINKGELPWTDKFAKRRFLSAVTHPNFRDWKALQESQTASLIDVYAMFLEEADKLDKEGNLKIGYTSGKGRVWNGKSGQSQSGNGKGKGAIGKASAGKATTKFVSNFVDSYVPRDEYRKLSREEKGALKKLREERSKKDETVGNGGDSNGGLQTIQLLHPASLQVDGWPSTIGSCPGY